MVCKALHEGNGVQGSARRKWCAKALHEGNGVQGFLVFQHGTISYRISWQEVSKLHYKYIEKLKEAVRNASENILLLLQEGKVGTRVNKWFDELESSETAQ